MSRTKYLADQIEHMLDSVRTQHKEWEAQDRADQVSGDGFERSATRTARKPSDGSASGYTEGQLKAAWDQNLHAANYAPSDGQMFGRKGRMRYRVLRPAAGAHIRMPPRSPSGQAALPAPRPAPSRAAPTPPGMRLQLTLDKAYEALERGRRAALDPLRRGAVAQMADASAGGSQGQIASPAPPRTATSDAVQPQAPPATARGQDHFVEPTTEPPTRIRAEATHADFEYNLAESAFWQYAAGAEIVSGQGADFFDPEGTRTFIFGRPA